MRIGPLPSVGSAEMSPLEKLQEMAGAIATGAAGAPGATGATNPTGMANMNVGAGMRAEFSNFLNKAVTEVEGKMRTAEAEKQKVLVGETNNLHQATIASSEAGIAFSLMVEVRNKLVESYQEIMRMQV
jgi:flagellar hook-basal body complex protein FliE